MLLAVRTRQARSECDQHAGSSCPVLGVLPGCPHCLRCTDGITQDASSCCQCCCQCCCECCCVLCMCCRVCCCVQVARGAGPRATDLAACSPSTQTVFLRLACTADWLPAGDETHPGEASPAQPSLVGIQLGQRKSLPTHTPCAWPLRQLLQPGAPVGPGSRNTLLLATASWPARAGPCPTHLAEVQVHELLVLLQGVPCCQHAAKVVLTEGLQRGRTSAMWSSGTGLAHDT